jgi:iron(III) transport system substrate-binding protein
MIEGVKPHPLIKKMGENFKQDLKTKVGDYKKNQADALEVMLMSGWK